MCGWQQEGGMFLWSAVVVPKVRGHVQLQHLVWSVLTNAFSPCLICLPVLQSSLHLLREEWWFHERTPFPLPVYCYCMLLLAGDEPFCQTGIYPEEGRGRIWIVDVPSSFSHTLFTVSVYKPASIKHIHALWNLHWHLLSCCCVRGLGFSHHHGFSLEKTAACWETCIQVPVCGLLPGTDGWVHQKMVRSSWCYCKKKMKLLVLK